MISPHVHLYEQLMPWRWRWLGFVARLTHVMKDLIAYETWHWVTWLRWRRSRQDLAWWTGCKCEGQVEWWLGSRWTRATVKSKWSQDRWTNMVMWWYGVGHIIVDHVGACVASTLKEMEWNAQGKGGGVCRGEMGLGPSLPPAELVRRDSALSGK